MADESNVVGLHGEKIPSGEPVPDCIEALELMLELARSGMIVGVAAIGCRADGTSGHVVGGFTNGSTVGEAQIVLTRLSLDTLQNRSV